MTPRGRMTPALAAEFAQAGVDRLVLLAPPAEDGAARTIEAGLAGRGRPALTARPTRLPTL